MRKIKFTKMVASGNDFVIVERDDLYTIRTPLSVIAKNICERKYGIGADGLLFLEKSKAVDVRMRIFNADGSEAAMCGNGARCVALYISSKLKAQSSKVKIETKAGIIASEINKDKVRIRLTDPRNIKLSIPLKIRNRLLHVNFINTGVPHTVIFVEGIQNLDVVDLGQVVRHHPKFKPAGTNVDFVEVFRQNSIKIRTYERGVEDETLACGTGAVAAALITGYRLQVTGYRFFNVYTKSAEVLKVYFDRIKNKFKDVWLEGKAQIVYQGEYDV